MTRVANPSSRKKPELDRFATLVTHPFKRSTKATMSVNAPLKGSIAKSTSDLLARLTMVGPVLGGSDELTNPFRESWVVYACTRARSNAVASIPLRIYVDGSDKAAEVAADHWVQRLFQSPNPITSGQMMRQHGAVHRSISGEDFWFLANDQGQPITAPASAGKEDPLINLTDPSQIICVSGFSVEDRRDANTGRINAWRYTTGNTMSPWYAPCSVVHFADYNPDDPQRGLGDAVVAIRQVAAAFQAERYQEAVLRSGGPGYYLVNEYEVDPIEDERQQRELEERIRTAPPGAPKLIRGKWTIVPVPTKSTDIAAIETMKWSRDVVASIMGVPLLVINVFDQATFSNLKESWSQFWNQIVTYLTSVADTINAHFFPRLSDPKVAKFRVAFDYANVKALQQDESDLWVKAATMAATCPGLSLNRAAGLLGLSFDPKPEGNMVFVPRGFCVLDTTTNPPTIIPPTVPPAAEGTASADPAKPKPSKGFKPLFSDPLETLGRAHLFVALTSDERRSYHKQFQERVSSKYDQRLYQRVLRWLEDYQESELDLLVAFAEHGPSAKRFTGKASGSGAMDEFERWLLLNSKTWEDSLLLASSPSIRSAFTLALTDEAEELGVLSIPMNRPEVREFLSTQETQLVEGVNGTLAERVKAALVDVLGAPSTIGDLQVAVQQHLPELNERLARVFADKEGRALTIARTETAKAVDNARVMQMREAGVDEIEWVSSHDDHVRHTHKDYDGQIRKFGDEFAPGLRWPHDVNGSAQEVINCRCIPRGIVKV